jgi:hypothetical protein
MAGGLDIENAQNMGNYGVMLNKKSLKDGVKEGFYNKAQVAMLISDNGNATTISCFSFLQKRFCS